MSRATRSGIAAFFLLVLAGLAWPRPVPDLHPDSYGRMGHGQRALFELLGELGVDVARSTAPRDALPSAATVWWLQPWSWCPPQGSAEIDAAAEGGLLESEPPGPSLAWLEGGGTALVFLPAWVPSEALPWVVLERDRRAPDCPALAGFELPARSVRRVPVDYGTGEPNEDPGEGVDGPGLAQRWWRGELDRLPLAKDYPIQRVDGAALPRSRALPMRPLHHFDASNTEISGLGFSVVARLSEEPFLLERRVGQGRLVVVADAGFLLNRWLDLGDAAPLALDLVRAYGTPLFEERIHGHSHAPGAIAYLAASPARPVFLGLAALGLLIWAHGSALPLRGVREHDPAAPALEPFVDALAALYAGSGDHGQLAERYREVSLARIRRHFSLPSDVSDARILSRLAQERRLDREELAQLAPGTAAPVTSAKELRAATARLDALVEEVCR